MTTVDMTTHFMRPLTKGTIEVETRILSNGRRLATVFVEFRQQGSGKVAASSTCAYAYLDPASATIGTAVEIGILGERYAAEVVEPVRYDPDNRLPRS